MLQNRKRTISLLLALVLLLGAFAFAPRAAKAALTYDVNDQATFVAAMNAINVGTDGGIINIKANTQVTDAAVAFSKDVEIALNGHTLTITENRMSNPGMAIDGCEQTLSGTGELNIVNTTGIGLQVTNGGEATATNVNGGNTGVQAESGAIVTITGTATSNAVAILAKDANTKVTAGAAVCIYSVCVSAMNSAEVTVLGDVTSIDGVYAIDNGKAWVKGSIIARNMGARAYTGGTLTVDGAISAGVGYVIIGSPQVNKAISDGVYDGLPTLSSYYTFAEGGVATNGVVWVKNVLPALSPATATFDKYAPADAQTALTLNGNALGSVTLGGAALTAGADYTVSGNTYTFQKAYLATLGMGQQVFTFEMASGLHATFTITVIQSTPAPPPTPAPIKATGVSLDVSILRQKPGSRYTLPVKFAPEGATQEPITYAVADETIARVSQQGEVSFLKPGRTIITVKVPSLKFEKQIVLCTTQEHIESLLMFPTADVTMRRGRFGKVAAYARPLWVADTGINYETSNFSNIMLMDNKGNFCAASGVGVITATSNAKTLEGKHLSQSVAIHVAE